MKLPPLHKGIPAFNRFLLLSALFLLLMVIWRLADLLQLQLSGKLPLSIGALLPKALLVDVLTFLDITRWLAIPYLLLYWLAGKRTADGCYLALIVLYTIVNFALNQYFHQTSVPLGADLFGYSISEIKQTVGAAGGLQTTTVVALLAVALVLALLIWLVYRRRIHGDRIGFWFVLACLLLLLVPFSKGITRNRFRAEYASNLAFNKTGYFLVKTFQYLFPQQAGSGGGWAITGDDDADALAKFSYISEQQYPFLHTLPYNNVLGPFLHTDSTRLPNIVIILVEGLGRAFAGKNAYLGSFTPFLDSLAEHSLYWENFLSGGGRTFAVLPVLTGSLPFGKNGYNELGERMPPAVSLLSIAKRNGYRTRFLYSGQAGFDKMDQYLQTQGIDTIIDENRFGSGYEKLPASNGFTWGYGDRELFRKYLDATPADTARPRLDILLTVSTHSPFRIPDQEHYTRLFEARMQALGLNAQQQAERREYKDVYATLLYMDHSLRYFFQAWAQRPDFHNTIFLVTGDHRLPEIPMRSKIDRYHTLLMVYSPLLQRKATFSAVSSHFDVAPSLLAWLQTHKGFNAPATGAWIGSGLDTARSFRNVHQYPLMQTKNELADYIAGTWFLNNGNLFRVLPNLDLEPQNDEGKAGQLAAGFNRFLQKNMQFQQQLQLVPDSLYRVYGAGRGR